MKKFLNYLSFITLLLAAGLFILVGYWYFFPGTPVKFFDTPHKVEKKTVKNGDFLIYDVKYCKYTDITPTLTKAFVDGIIYYLPDTNSRITKKGCGTNRIFVFVPKELPIGVYHIAINWHYQVNPVQSVNIYTETEKFTVIK